MIKVVNLVSLLAAPIIVRNNILGVGGWMVVAALLLVMVWAVWQSKRPVPAVDEQPLEIETTVKGV